MEPTRRRQRPPGRILVLGLATLVVAASLAAAAALLGPRSGGDGPGTGNRYAERVKIFLVADGDNGRRGRQIGCNDSLVPVDRPLAPADRVEPVRAALEALFAVRLREYDATGLTTALWQAELRVDRVSVDGGRTTVRIGGRPLRGGMCDDPRFVEQILATARQFPWSQDAVVLVNGTPIETLLSQRG